MTKINTNLKGEATPKNKIWVVVQRSDMVDTCQEKIFIHTFFSLRSKSYLFFQNLLSGTGPSCNDGLSIWYTRIGYLHGLASSWSCPNLKTGVSVIIPIPWDLSGVLRPWPRPCNKLKKLLGYFMLITLYLVLIRLNAIYYYPTNGGRLCWGATCQGIIGCR